MVALKIVRSYPRFYEKPPEKHFFFTLYSPQKVAQLYFSLITRCFFVINRVYLRYQYKVMSSASEILRLRETDQRRAYLR